MRPEDAIGALQADHLKRSSEYQDGKAIWERLIRRLQQSELGQTFPITGTVDTQDYCTSRGVVSCDIEITINGDDLSISPSIVRKGGNRWLLDRYDHPQDEVMFTSETELEPLIVEYIVFTSKQKTSELLGEDEDDTEYDDE